MKKKILALCDSEKDYLENLTAYIRDREGLPFEIHAYSAADKLLEFGKKEKIELLVVAESDYTYEVAEPETKSQGLFHQIHKQVTFC